MRHGDAAPGKSNTSCSITWPSSPSNLMVSLPLPGTTKSVARYWSPKAWRPMMIGWVQPGIRRGTFLQMIGSRKTTPPRMLRMVPLGDFHICLRWNSFTRASSGVMVAHLMPTPALLDRVRPRRRSPGRRWRRGAPCRGRSTRVGRSRNGRISLSLISFQMMRVISSPSRSTTGLATLILAMRTEGLRLAMGCRRGAAGAAAFGEAIESFRGGGKAGAARVTTGSADRARRPGRAASANSASRCAARWRSSRPGRRRCA